MKKVTKQEAKKIAESFIKKLSPLITRENEPEEEEDNRSSIELREDNNEVRFKKEKAHYYIVSFIDLGKYYISFRVWFFADAIHYDVEFNDTHLIDSSIVYDNPKDIDNSIEYCNLLISQLVNTIDECNEFDIHNIPVKNKINIALENS